MRKNILKEGLTYQVQITEWDESTNNVLATRTGNSIELDYTKTKYDSSEEVYIRNGVIQQIEHENFIKLNPKIAGLI